MRLLGVALLGAWLVAWWASPHGEPTRSTTSVGAMAIAGGERAAVAWLELPMRGESMPTPGRLRVAFADETNTVRPLFDVPAQGDETDYRVAETGDGRFVLATEFQAPGADVFHSPSTPRVRPPVHYEFERFGPDSRERTRVTLLGSANVSGWQLAAAGDQLTLVEEIGEGSRVFTLAPGGHDWLPPREVEGRVLLGSAGGQLIRYEVGRHGDDAIAIRGADGTGLDATTAKPDYAWGCRSMAAASEKQMVPVPQIDVRLPRSVKVSSVVPLRGGWARLSRNAERGCVDGVRDGQPFAFDDIDLRLFERAQLTVDDGGRLAVWDVRKRQVQARRVLLPEIGTRPPAPGTDGKAPPRYERALVGDEPGGVNRYRLFGRGGPGGVPAVLTRVALGDNALFFERHRSSTDGGASNHGSVDEVVASVRLGPDQQFMPDHRPVLRPLAAIPLLVLLLGAFGPLRLLRRLRKLRPVAANAAIPAGEVTVEGTLARDADAPEGGLRLRRGQSVMRLFIDGADVLRATEVRPRSEPGGDAVDVASGASVCATGTFEQGHAFRGDDTLHARKGDLVLVGCTLAEARARVLSRLASSALLLGGAAAVIAGFAMR